MITEKSKSNLRPMIRIPGFVYPAVRVNLAPDISLLVEVAAPGIALTVAQSMRIVEAASKVLMLKPPEMRYSLKCHECGCLPSSDGTYTLSLCVNHEDLVLVCDACMPNHRALHQLEGNYVDLYLEGVGK